MMSALNMQGVARGYLVYDLTSSPIILGMVSAGFAVPMLALALFGGAFADRFERRRIIQFCQALGGCAAVAIAIAISTKTITWGHLMVSSVLNGVIFAFLVPARTALILQLVGRDLVGNALALNAAAMSSTTLLAPAIAGNLYHLLGPEGVYYVIAGLMFVAVLLTGLIGKHEDGANTVSRSQTMLRSIGIGLSYIRRNSLVLILLIMGLATTLLAMPFRFMLPIFVVDVYHRGPEALGYLASMMGIGALVGSIAVAGMGKWRRGLVLLSGGFISGAALLAIGFFPAYLAASLAMVFVGLGDALRRSLNMALILESTEKSFQGRVSSVYTMNFGLMPLGVLPASLISKYFGPRASAGVLAVLLILVCLALLISQRRLRQIN